MIAMVLNFMSEDQGVTSIEYALIASLIFVVVLAGIMALGASAEAMYNAIATAMGGL